MNIENNIAGLLTIKEAAKYLRVSTSWFYQNYKDVLPKVGITSRPMFKKEDLDEFIKNRTMSVKEVNYE